MDKFLPKFDVKKTKKIDNLLSNEINSFTGFEKLSAEEKIDTVWFVKGFVICVKLIFYIYYIYFFFKNYK